MSRNLKNDDIFDKAVALAKKSCMCSRHGCVIVKDGEIIGSGYNYQLDFMCHGIWSIHAEVAAIMSVKNKFKKNLDDATMVVVRIGADVHGCPLRMSKPCQRCTQAIKKAGIKKVFYSSDEP